MKTLFLALSIFLFSFSTYAINTEIGINYNYKKTTFDESNTSEQQASTVSLSLYFWEKVALELSYTNGLAVKKEKDPYNASDFLRTTTQTSDVYGADLIFVLSDRKAVFQPYLKAGAAYINKKLTVQDDNNNPWSVVPPSSMAPSAGIGFKFFITEAFALRTSYDVIQTPIDSTTKAYDTSGRVGLSWML